MTKILLNGVEVEADPSKPLIAACAEHAEHVPMYCYHPGLSPVGSCRICQVEVKQGDMPPRVVVACKTPVVDGMIVDTEAPKAHDARKQCLEFLLKNHPLDCPICDKAGECTLQDFSFQEGQAESRSAEPRRKLEKRKSLGDTIVLDQERCILCSRCVRFFEDVTDEAQLTVSGLGSRSVISTFADRPLHGNYQGNIADICPVGALTLKQFRFQARVWNLRKQSSTCGECSRGCAITVEVLRRKEVKRIRPRYDGEVNRWWMCDEGRFATDRQPHEGRLGGGRLRGARGLEPVESAVALDRAAEMLGAHEPRVVLVSPWITQEEAALALDLCKALGTAPRFLSPAANDLADDLLHTGDPCPNRKGLESLGFEAVDAEAARELLAGGGAALLAGERIADLLGEETLAGLPDSLRLFVLDTREVDAPAVNGCVGVTSCVERSGHWLNVDGLRRDIHPARPAPTGAADLERLLEHLLVRTSAASEGAASR